MLHKKMRAVELQVHVHHICLYFGNNDYLISDLKDSMQINLFN